MERRRVRSYCALPRDEKEPREKTLRQPSQCLNPYSSSDVWLANPPQIPLPPFPEKILNLLPDDRPLPNPRHDPLFIMLHHLRNPDPARTARLPRRDLALVLGPRGHEPVVHLHAHGLGSRLRMPLLHHDRLHRCVPTADLHKNPCAAAADGAVGGEYDPHGQVFLDGGAVGGGVGVFAL